MGPGLYRSPRAEINYLELGSLNSINVSAWSSMGLKSNAGLTGLKSRRRRGRVMVWELGGGGAPGAWGGGGQGVRSLLTVVVGRVQSCAVAGLKSALPGWLPCGATAGSRWPCARPPKP